MSRATGEDGYRVRVFSSLLGILALILLAVALEAGPAHASLGGPGTVAGAPGRCPGPGAACGALTAPVVAAAPPVLRVGTQRLTRCQLAPLAYCGTLPVPLDHAEPSGPHIAIAYRWYPASAPGGAPSGTVVPVEGGPGYGSVGSVNSGYAVQYAGLLAHWNMLAVDNRGTGHSSPLDCPALQGFSGPTASPAFRLAGAACAAELNHRWRGAGGGWVHASDLFTSAPAAADLASVIGALDLPAVDLYGDSYGSFFAQVFASRYPSRVRSVILDSTYPVSKLDPWYRSAIKSMPSAFDSVCARSPACATAAPGSSWSRIVALSGRLRERELAGTVPGPTGTLEHVSMDAVGLVDLINDAAADPQIYRGLDAAARALLDEGQPAPLLRLYAQRLAVDEAYFGQAASSYSVGLYLAVSCLDYPQLFDMSASPLTRANQLAAAEAALPQSTFSPFTTVEWLAQNQNTEAYSACLGWPSPTIAQPPTTGMPPLFPRDLPVLVMGGELDTWTPPADVGKVLAQIGGHSRFIQLANATHVVGEGDTVCATRLITEFVTDPRRVGTLDASCAGTVPPIHAVGAYPAALAGLAPLEPAKGSSSSMAARRLAAAAVATAGDAVARALATEAPRDHGLFGGTATTASGAATITLHGDRLLADAAVSGTLELRAAANELDGIAVVADLTVVAGGGVPASFTVSWTTGGAGARAIVSGEVGGEAVEGSLPAP